MFQFAVACLILVLAAISTLACGSDAVRSTSTPVPSSPTETPALTATHVPVPVAQPTAGSATPAVTIDDDSISIEVSRDLSGSGKARGVRSSTTYSPQTGKTEVSTNYVISENLVALPWLGRNTTPASKEAPCNTLGTRGTWRGNPMVIGESIKVGQTNARVVRSDSDPNALHLVVQNSGPANVEIPDYSFEFVDNMQSQSTFGLRDYKPKFAESIELAPNESRELALDLVNLSEDPIEPGRVVLTFLDRMQGDTAYLRITDPPDDADICTSYEAHPEAQDVGTTWLNRPASLGRAVKVDETTTVRITYAERSTAEHLLEAYNDLDLEGAYPKNSSGGLAEGFELLALQMEVASTYPLIKDQNAVDWLESIGVSGRVKDEYSLEFNNMLATPGTGNLALLEAPLDDADLGRSGYMRISIVAVIPVEANGLWMSYRQDSQASPVFLSLEENPEPAPTPFPIARVDVAGRVGILEEIEALDEERMNALLETSSASEMAGYRSITSDCAQHKVFPSSESRRNVSKTAERLAGSAFVEALPHFFENTDDPDAFCDDLFPASSVERMVDVLLFDGQSSLAETCAFADQYGFVAFTSLLTWRVEVGLALWGEDAPVSIDSFDDVSELCDWLTTYTSDGG